MFQLKLGRKGLTEAAELEEGRDIVGGYTESHVFNQWDIVSRDGTDHQLVYDISPQQLRMVCIKPSDCDYMQDDNWVIGETESNVPWRYGLVSKCLTPMELLKKIGRSDLWTGDGANDSAE